MTAVAALMLLLSLMLTAFGTLAYINCAFNDPDPDSMRIARGIATLGQPVTAWALVAWFGNWQNACPLIQLLLVAATASGVLSFATRLGAPGAARRAAP